MGNLASAFLTEAQQQQIRDAVAQAEARTAGEIVVLVVSASYHYPMAAVRAALFCALPLGLLLTPVAGGWLWLGRANLWVFLALATVLGIVAVAAVNHWAVLKRWLTPVAEMEAEVREAAVTGFFNHRLHCTRDQSGVLIFISVLEHKVWVLADKGICDCVGEGAWSQTVALITDGIRRRQPCPAICAAVQQVGDLLALHFPPRPGDTDELKAVIVEA